eukprot:PhF_6_TR34177/c0_g1_i1/m.50011
MSIKSGRTNLECLALLLPAVHDSPMYDGVEAWSQLRPVLLQESKRCPAFTPFQKPLEDNNFTAIQAMSEHTFTPRGDTPLELFHSHVVSLLMKMVHAIAQRRGHYHVREVLQESYESVCASRPIHAALYNALSSTSFKKSSTACSPDELRLVWDIVDFETIFYGYVLMHASDKEVRLLGATYVLSVEAARVFFPHPGIGVYKYGTSTALTTTSSSPPSYLTQNPTIALAFDGVGDLYAARPNSNVVLQCEVKETHLVKQKKQITFPAVTTLTMMPSGEMCAANTKGTIGLLGNNSKLFDNPYGVQSLHALNESQVLVGSVVRVFDVRDGSSRRVGNAIGWHVCPLPGGTHFLLTDPYEREVQLWDIMEERVVSSSKTNNVISCSAVCQERSNVVVGMVNGEVALWDTRTAGGNADGTQHSLPSFFAHKGAVRGVAVSHGAVVTSGEDDDAIRVWSWHRPKEGLHVYEIEGEECVSALTVQTHGGGLGDCILFATPAHPAHVIQLKLLERL